MSYHARTPAASDARRYESVAKAGPRYDGRHREDMTVHALIERHLGAIHELCRRHRVRRLEVFGSAARSVDFDPQRSDVDFLVEFDVAAGTPTLANYFGLRDELAMLLGRPVDLVTADASLNPYVKAEVDRGRRPVYAAA